LDTEATDHCQKGNQQDGRLPELLLAQSCLTNHSRYIPCRFANSYERSRSLSARWPGLAGSVGHWLAVVLVIFQRPSCGLPYSGGFRFHCRYCTCASKHTSWHGSNRPDFQMALVLVCDEVKDGDLPGGTDLRQSILYGEFLGCRIWDVLDLVSVLVETPVDDPLQGEVLRLVVKLPTSLRLKASK